MGHLVAGYVFTESDIVTATKLNALTGSGRLNVGTQAGVNLQPSNDYVLYLRQGTLYQTTWAEMQSLLRVDSLTLNSTGGAAALQTSAGVGTFSITVGGGTKRPVQMTSTAEDNSLYVTATGVGIRNTGPTVALDVTGDVKASVRMTSPVFKAEGAYPQILFSDTQYPGTYYGILYYNGAPPSGGGDSACNLEFRSIVVDGSTTHTTPAKFSTLGPDDSMVLGPEGGLLLNKGLRVTPPATATSAGIAGQVAFGGSEPNYYIYLCVATNTWRRQALTLTTWT